MGKRNVVPKLPNPAASKVGNESPLNAALGPIVTADEYRRAVIALVDGVEDVSDDNKKMLDLSAASRRLLLARYDPPLPLWWTFIALEKSLWLDRKSKDPLGFGTAILDFARRALHSLISLSSVNASGRTTLAAIAPVVGLVYDVASLLSTTAGPLDENQSSSGTVEGNGKLVCKLSRNLKEFIKELLGFRILCLCQDSKTFERSCSLPSAPNVPLENFPDFLHPQFPLASKSMAKSLSRDLNNSAVLAEIVSGEVVLLQLVVETIDRRIVLKKRDTNFSVGQDEYFQRLKNLAVHSVWAANSPSPSEMLLDALLEKRLPVLDLLDAKEETFVRGVLLETVLADPPIFSSYADAGEASTSFKSGLDHSSVVFMKKLSVARRAVASFRSREELSRLATLERQMTTWHVPPQLLKWLKSQKKQRLPVVAMQDQQALTKWLVKTAEKSVFTAILDKCVASWSSGLSSVGTAKHIEVLEVESGEAHPDRDGEDLFFVDTAGETKAAIDKEAAADLDFAVASKTMKGESEKMKKKNKVLFHRHQHFSTGTKRSRMEIDDVDASSSSGSDSSLTISPAEPVVLSPGKSGKKKKRTKDPEGPYIGAVSAGTEEVPSQLDNEMDNSSVSVTKLDIQKTSKLVSGYPEADSEGKGAAHENVVVITTREVVETRVEVQGVDAKDLANEVTTTTGEEVETRRSSPQTSLTLQNENGEEIGDVALQNENGEEIGDVAARVQITTLRNVQEETLVVKASKKKRRKENSGHGDEADQIQIFDAIKQELFTASAKLSSADLINSLQVEKSLQNNPQEGSRNTTSRNKRARSGDDGDSIGDVQGTTTREPAATVSVANSDAMKSENESTQDGKSSEGDGVLAEILGNGQAEDVNRVSHDESEPRTSKSGFTEVTQPIDCVVLGAHDGSQDTDRLIVQPTKSPIKNLIELPELRTQGTPASGTSSGSKLKKNRDVTSTPTSRKKRSKDQKATAVPAVAEDRIPPKEEVVVVSSETPEILQDEKDQGEGSVRTPNPSKVSETEPVTSVKQYSRKRKVKPEISASVESESADENQYQRRTRSGRALGTPPPTPTRKVNTRKKLVLEPLEEEK